MNDIDEQELLNWLALRVGEAAHAVAKHARSRETGSSGATKSRLAILDNRLASFRAGIDGSVTLDTLREFHKRQAAQVT